ncbi:MAG: phosphoribosylamine--glycine ligase [Deltaproteobacteria bacterium]
MKILVIGGGGREHAIVWKLAQSPKVSKIFCAPGNGGIASLAECINIKATDLDGIVGWAKNNPVDLVVVAPDDPLAMGMVDELEKAGIKAFGNNKRAAYIEASKVFSKDLMKKYNIPTAKYEVFEEPQKAKEYLKTCSFPTVVKAEGLALGKGVIIAQDLQEAFSAVDEIMTEKKFGESGSRIVIEEFLIGQEVSMVSFTDGKTIIPMVSAQDHKRVYDNDQGPNTGGMGVFAPSRIYTKEIADYCMEHIYIPTIKAMEAENRKLKGILYFGLMFTKDGPKVLEYNARFGDPETQAVLPMLKTDLIDIFEAIIDERLDKIDIEWHEGGSACVVMASGGYPGEYKNGYEITGIKQAEELDCIVFSAGTRLDEGKLVTAGGRVLGVTAIGESLDKALEKAYAGVEKIHFEGAHFRRDIGKK